jgi:hypothetical protein
MKKTINKFFTNIKNKFRAITIAKFISAFITIIILAIIRYYLFGGFYLDPEDIINNIRIGTLGWIVNQTTVVLLTDYLNSKGINFNLNEIWFGLHRIEGNAPSLDTKEFKPKIYNAMDSDNNMETDSPMETDDVMESDKDSNSGKPLDKGKGVDREVHPFHGSNINNAIIEDMTKPSDKGKEITPVTEPPFALWKRVFPGLDPSSIIHPKRINPGPGFNVPGGQVPIRDEICKHIDYNSHILKQFRTMDLEVAIEQRNNNLRLINVLENKLAFAQNALSKIPQIPTTDYEFRLKNKIISDLNHMNNDKARAEARVTLLSSRIDFIQLNINYNNNN